MTNQVDSLWGVPIPAKPEEPKLKCVVCGKPAVGVACSSTGPVSFAYCAECLRANREPYGALVASVVGIESWDLVAEWYRPVVLSNLKAEGKTLEEFFADVEEAQRTITQAMEAGWTLPTPPTLSTSPPLAVYPEGDL